MIFWRKYGRANITSLVERKSRYTMLIKNQNSKSTSLMIKIREKLTTLAEHYRRSVTFDRGSEFAYWKILLGQLEYGPYYCKPQASRASRRHAYSII